MKHDCLKRLRKAAQLTQKEFAQLTGIPWGTLVSIEVGKRRLTRETAEVIAAVTGAAANSLLKPAGSPEDFVGQKYTADTYKAHHAKYSPPSFSRRSGQAGSELDAEETGLRRLAVAASAEDDLSEAALNAEERALFETDLAPNDIEEMSAAVRGLLLQATTNHRLESVLVACGYAVAKLHRDFALPAPKPETFAALGDVACADPQKALASILERAGALSVTKKARRRPATNSRKR